MLPAIPPLDTPRLRLRALTAADAPALFAIFGDPAVMRYWSSPPLAEPADALALVARTEENFRAGRRVVWGVEHRTAGVVVGTCSLGNLDAQNRRGEIGYALASAYWGQGLMAEAQRAVIDFGFAEQAAGGLGLLRLEADIDPRNAASRRALERLGFQLEGYLRERWIVNGEICDTQLFGLLRREWLARGG